MIHAKSAVGISYDETLEYFLHKNGSVELQVSDIDLLEKEYRKAYNNWEKIQSILARLYRGVELNLAQEFGA